MNLPFFSVKPLAPIMYIGLLLGGFVLIAGCSETDNTSLSFTVALPPVEQKAGVTLNPGENDIGIIRMTRTINMPPTVTITSPEDKSVHTFGQCITFAGTASDPEDGELPASAYTWRDGDEVIYKGGSHFLFSSPTPGCHTITLTVTDSRGATGAATRILTFHPPVLPVITNSAGMEFVRVSPGTFLMGSPDDEPGRDFDEGLHPVTLSNEYYLQTKEVTQGQWEAVMGSNPSYFSGCGSTCPVEQVSWEDVQNFIRALNARGDGTYRLPTEAEWEYACRAGGETAFAGGGITETGRGEEPNLSVMGWYSYNSGFTTHPVAQKQANAWGFYDMHGNVWEWCGDWKVGYPKGAVTDPAGPASGVYRVMRGGSWDYIARYCRSAGRYDDTPDYRFSNTGFRLVMMPAK
ncbi:MAG: SUMF1/EgtB/PvdO family nonheme iron enzyme [Desulfosalsimonadaceae bacterium]